MAGWLVGWLVEVGGSLNPEVLPSNNILIIK